MSGQDRVRPRPNDLASPVAVKSHESCKQKRVVSNASPYLLVELQVEDEPAPEDIALFADRLYQHNATVTGWDNGRWLTIVVRNDAGVIVPGLHGWTWGQTGFVQTLWVREDLRRAGLGGRLLTTAEVEAVRRGCREMHLDTIATRRPTSTAIAGTR